MKQLTNKEYQKYLEFKKAESQGRVLTPDGLLFICRACNYNPLDIGNHFLSVLAKFTNDSAFSNLPVK